MTKGSSPVAGAASLIRVDGEGHYTWSAWDQVSTDAMITTGVGRQAGFGLVGNDWWTLLTIITKLEWMQDSRKDASLDRYTWMYFAATEIDFFHVRIRSLLDHVAQLLARCSQHPSSTSRRFFKLKENLGDETKRAQFGPLGESTWNVLKNTAWADEVKKVRDDIVHHGAATLVFPDEEETLFQTHQRQANLIVLEGAMYNDNVVDFRRYAALTLGALMLFLEDLAPILRAGLKIEDDGPSQGWSRHGGLALLKEWIELPLLRD